MQQTYKGEKKIMQINNAGLKHAVLCIFMILCNKCSLTVCDDSSIHGRFNDGDIQARVDLIFQNIW